jgi:hypothetical protein
MDKTPEAPDRLPWISLIQQLVTGASCYDLNGRWRKFYYPAQEKEE